MNKKFVIWDMDGTLVDSMSYWSKLGREYLESKGITKNIEDVLEEIKPMTMSESAKLFVERFALKETPQQVEDEMNHIMDEHYRKDIPLKDGIKTYLESLWNSGVQMCVASATAEDLMKVCLKRLDILKYFQFVLSCETVGAGKRFPDVYFESAKRLGALAQDIAVYEDALYAAKTAKKAGFYTVGVYDESGKNNWDELKDIADEVVC